MIFPYSVLEHHPHLIRLNGVEDSMTALRVMDEKSLRDGGYS